LIRKGFSLNTEHEDTKTGRHEEQLGETLIYKEAPLVARKILPRLFPYSLIFNLKNLNKVQNLVKVQAPAIFVLIRSISGQGKQVEKVGDGGSVLRWRAGERQS
jgi:hypothetical protein